MTIAVTGPFAGGKSTFVEMLGDLGAETVSADEIVHDLLAGDERTISQVVERFGEEVRGEQGIDRRALGKKVFGDAEALTDLEGILHPLVRRETGRRSEESGAGLFVAEIPLLFEGGGYTGGTFDFTVAVTSPEEQRKSWAGDRGVDEAQRRAIEDRQLSGEEKARLADIVVKNDGDLAKLRRQAVNLRNRLVGERGSSGSEEEEE